MEDLEASVLAECCELLNTITEYPENKKCFDCADDHTPRYLCSTFSTFVCSCCAKIHQEFGHKIKMLSIFSFTVDEIHVLKETGNRVAADKWLARWRPDILNEPNPTSPTYKEDAREYIRLKYLEKKWVKVCPPLPPSDVVVPPKSKSALVSPRKLPEIPTSRADMADVSPRDPDISPRSDADVTPRGATDVSPRGDADVIPRGGDADVSPRGAAEVSPRDVSPSSSKAADRDVDMSQENDSNMPQLFDNDKSTTQQPTREVPIPTPPIVYVPQPVYIPMSIPAQYGYSQYHVPLELNQYPHHQYYSRRSGDFQPLLYSYPLANSRMAHPVFVDGGAPWPGPGAGHASRDFGTEQQQFSQSSRNLRSNSLPDDAPSTGILRSISDISLATAALQPPEECTSNCKCSSCSAQNSNKVENKVEYKLKMQGLRSRMSKMSKVTGLLGAKR